MLFSKNPIQKNNLFTILVLVILLAGLFFFGFKSYRLSAKLKNTSSNFEKTNTEASELRNKHNKLQGDYSKLENDLKAITADRDNLLVQAKRLAEDRGRADELDKKVDQLKKEIEVLDKDKSEALGQNYKYEEENRNLKTIQEQLLKEKEQLSDTLLKERSKSFAKDLEAQRAKLAQENNLLNNDLKKAAVSINQLKENSLRISQELNKTKKEKEELAQKVQRLNKSFAQAVEKNKALQNKVADLPKKYAEIARQNKALIRQTANMHYNLGVFYTKSKEYARAIAEFEKSVELAPDDAYAHFNLGYIYAEYLVNRPRAIEHLRHYLRLAKNEDKDVDWAKKYILTWQAWEGKEPMK